MAERKKTKMQMEFTAPHVTVREYVQTAVETKRLIVAVRTVVEQEKKLASFV